MKEIVNEVMFGLEVLQSTEPVVVDFWAPWCGPCKSMLPLLEEVAGTVKVVKVNVDELPELTQQWNIQSIPTLLYFSEGKVKNRTTGLQTKKAILEQVQKL